MMTAASLCIERSGGEQVVRPPRATDGIGAALRGSLPVGDGMPAELAALLRRLDETPRTH